MQKTFEFVAGILIVIFMVVVFHQAVTQNKRTTAPVVTVTTPVEQPEEVAKTQNEDSFTSEDFAFALQEAVQIEIGRPIEGYEPAMFMQVFPGLLPEDFDGVEALIGYYTYIDGELVHEIGDVDMIHSAAPAVSEVGMDTLLSNVVERLAVDPTTTNVEDIVVMLRDIADPYRDQMEDSPIACTMDAMQCPDGSYVGRVGPDCDFEACPSAPTDSPGVTVCSPESKLAEACTMEYAPVCGLVDVQCVTTPCNPVPETFSNGCAACARGNVLSYTDGACLNLQ